MSAQADAGEKHRKAPYHHGNLKAALLDAALEILDREGMDAFGLRSVARLAGVSPAAPAHHFGNKEGLLAAVAAEGFRRLAAKQDLLPVPGDDFDSKIDHFNALGLTYVSFARANPQLYQLMFGKGLTQRAQYPELLEAGDAAYSGIEEATHAVLEAAGNDTLPPKVAINAAWSMVHGLASLLNDGKVTPGELGNPPEQELIPAILDLLGRGLASGARGD